MKIGRKKGHIVTEETKKKISNTLKRLYKEGKIECFEKGHLGFGKGQPRSEEVKRTISESNKGTHHSPMTEFKKGHKLSEKTRKAIRESNKKRIVTEETRKKLRARLIWNKGRCWDDKSKKIMSKSRLKYLDEHPECIEQFKEMRKKWITPKKDTKIELKIQMFLKELGYEFFTHQYMKEIKHGYQCDILIPALNLVIECDGDYWHKYPIGKDIDYIRTKELLQKGFKVLRLWENEIKVMDITKFKERLRK